MVGKNIERGETAPKQYNGETVFFRHLARTHRHGHAKHGLLGYKLSQHNQCACRWMVTSHSLHGSYLLFMLQHEKVIGVSRMQGDATGARADGETEGAKSVQKISNQHNDVSGPYVLDARRERVRYSSREDVLYDFYPAESNNRFGC